MWENRGLAFDATKQGEWSKSWSFAQSPQALEVGGERRVYFTSRQRDATGQWTSLPFFVRWQNSLDLTHPEFGQPVGPLLDLGASGAFDEHGIFPFSPLLLEGQLFAYTTGWQRRVSVPVETAIGLAVSDSSGDFRRHGVGPVLTRSMHEPFLVCDAYVRQLHGKLMMWYSFGTQWLDPGPGGEPQRVYKIGVAESGDGVSWVPSQGIQAVPDRRGPLECQALPSVVEYGNRLIMAYCFRDAFDFRSNRLASYRIGFAESLDGRDWSLLTGEDWVVPRASFDGGMQAYPGLFATGASLLLFYNGNEFGREGFGYARWVD